MMILNVEHFIVVYIDHVVNSIIANQTKFIFNSINKLNMKFVRVSMYLFQFRFKIYHRFDKFNLIFDALSRLFNTVDKNNIVDNLNIKSFHSDIIDFELNHFYAFNQSLITMNDVFNQKLKAEYISDKIWFNILKLLKNLINRIELKQSFASMTKHNQNFRNFESSNEIIDVDEIVVRRSIESVASSTIIVLKQSFISIEFFVSTIEFIIVVVSTSTINESLSQNVILKIKKIATDIDFQLHDELIYHVKKDIFRLCILSNCEQNVFKLTHDDCFHAEHHRVYARLINVVYVHKLFRKFTIYIRHCSVCQLNQIKRHRFYDELTSFFISSIFFHTLIMNWEVIFSINKNDFDCIFNVTCKFSRKLQSIQDKIIYFVVTWANLLIDRLQLIDWDISLIIISNRDFKFLSKFWTILFERLSINLFFSSIYHSQTNDQSERINQIFEIAFRYFIIEHSELNWVEILSALQLIFNNALNAFIERIFNEIVYEFKMREILHVVVISVVVVDFVAIDFAAAAFAISKKNIDSKTKQQLTKIEQTRFRYRIEAADVIFYVNAKFKIMYDARHVFLLLKSSEKTYFRLHHEYTLSDKLNRKLFNQRCDFFLIQKRVDRLIYQLTLSFQWKIHSVISITQLKFYSNENSYQRFRSNYFDEVEIEKLSNTTSEKNYKMKNLIDRRQKTFDKTAVKQYLIHWKNYESEYDEWKFIIKLVDFLELIEQYEIEHSSDTFINELKIDKKTFSQVLILKKSIIDRSISITINHTLILKKSIIDRSISTTISQTLILKKFIDVTNFVSRDTTSFRRDRLKKKWRMILIFSCCWHEIFIERYSQMTLILIWCYNYDNVNAIFLFCCWQIVMIFS